MRKSIVKLLKHKKNYALLIMLQIILIVFFIIFSFNKVKAARNYTSINSSTIFDKSSLDTLKLNIKDYPEVTVEGSAKPEIRDPKKEARDNYRVEFHNIPKGNKIDAVVTAIFKNCGTLNGKDIDMKIVYSNMIASDCIYAPNESFLFWKAYGTIENQKDENEWWYAGIERVDLNISFYYHNEDNPIKLDSAYISIYSEDKGEGIYSSNAAENYLYDDTTIEYHPDNYKTQYVSKYYANVFVGTAMGSTASGNKERVGFRYENQTNLKISLYAFDETQNVGYHLRFIPLTGVVPDNPVKNIVNKKEYVKPGEEIVYEVKQSLIKRFDESFQYNSLIFSDTLDNRLDFNSIKIEFSNGNEITQAEMEQDSGKMGYFNFDKSANKIIWKLDWESQHLDSKYSFMPFQMLQDANGGWIKFIITTTVKEDAQEGSVKNKAITKIQNKYELESNDVETVIKNEEIVPKPTKGKVIVHHMDKISGDEITRDEIEGNIGKYIRTNSKNIEGYTLTDYPSIESYMVEEEEKHVYYYYTYIGTIIVHHVDEVSKLEFSVKSESGLEGTTFNTSVYDKNPKYKIFRKPETEQYTFSKKIQHVYYYYKQLGKLTVHYMDENTKEELDFKNIEGFEKDIVTTSAIDIKDYKLLKKPETEQYELTVNGQDVYYYYAHVSQGILIKHIDVVTNELIEPEEMRTGTEGESYNISHKTFDNYTFIQDTGNTSGTMTRDLIEIRFDYIYNSQIRVHHVYGTEGGEDVEIVSGKEGDEYITYPKNNPVGHDGKLYKLDMSNVVKNASGKLKKQNDDIYYYYIPKTGKIKIKHVDKATKEDIVPETVLEGFTGNRYEINKLDNIEYELVEEPKNREGSFTEDTEEIVFYYLKKTYIIVNYIDENTEVIMGNEKIDGLETNEYITNPKDFLYYNLNEDKYPENSTGKFEKNEIVINYYYTQLPFNLKVNQKIDKIIVNEKQTEINKTLGKIEINKNMSEYNIKIYYKITVSNNMEIEGNTVLKDYIPDGFCALEEDNPNWTINGKNCMLNIENIEPGEEREYIIVLTNTDKKIVGTIQNEVTIENSNNKANFDETTYIDNKANTQMIIGISTGGMKNIRYIAVVLVTIFGLIIFLSKVLNKKQ